MGSREEPEYRQIKGICRKCGNEFTYHNSIRMHPDWLICPECEKVPVVKPEGYLPGELSDFTYLLTFGNSLDIYSYGCLRVGIERNTGRQVLGYVATEKKVGG